ncbi:MAG: alpha amylase C-terminal domain-containing protein [Blautia sp.]
MKSTRWACSWPGKYKEIFNSDRKEHGGSGAGNPRVKHIQKGRVRRRKDSITITVPPTERSFAYTGLLQERNQPGGKNG